MRLIGLWLCLHGVLLMIDLGVITKEEVDKEGKTQTVVIGEKRCLKCNKRLCECDRDITGKPLWIVDVKEITDLKERVKKLEDKVYGV